RRAAGALFGTGRDRGRAAARGGGDARLRRFALPGLGQPARRIHRHGRARRPARHPRGGDHRRGDRPPRVRAQPPAQPRPLARRPARRPGASLPQRLALRPQGPASLARDHAAGFRVAVNIYSMVEVLLVLTLLAAAATAGLLAFSLMRARSAEREAREELSRGLANFSQTLTVQMGSNATVQNAQFETLRGAVEQQLGRMQQDNAAKLEQMRQTVDEKLHATLEKRLSESFRQVSERLEVVHKGLGEMQTLAAGVGDLKRVLSNVRVRGVFGETQLAALLEQVMAPDQY